MRLFLIFAYLYRFVFAARIVQSCDCTGWLVSALVGTQIVGFLKHMLNIKVRSFRSSSKGDSMGHIAQFLVLEPSSVTLYKLATIIRFQNFTQGKGTSRQRSGKGAIRKRFPLQKPRWEKNQTNNQVLIP